MEQTEPFAKNALGKPCRNADQKIEIEGFLVAGEPEITGEQGAGITSW